FYDFFFIVAFLKALLKGKPTKLILKKPLLYLLFYLIFLFIISFFVYGMNFELISSTLRKFTVFTLFISFPFLVYRKEDFFKFMHLVFPIIFLIIFAEFFHLFTGNRLYYFIIGEGTSSIIQLQESKGYYDFIRPTSIGVMLVLFSFIFTLFLIEKKDYPGKKFYLYLILILSLLASFITATRSWIVMFAIVSLFYLLFVVEKRARLLFQVFLITLILFLSYLFIPRFDYSVDNSLRRLSTIEDLIQGDVTAGGTLQRIDKRLPRVLEGFEQNPILGWGFSETYRKYSDGHVGTFNLLLQVGIIGLILFVNLWINYLKMIFFTRKRLSKSNVLKNPLLVLVIAFLGILILQLTQFVFFSYDLLKDVTYFIILFISFSEFFVKEALKEEKKGGELR
ncbi:MAG: O-antigen ligase family protein, partial [Candidatus Aminicenantes bacterium]